MSLISCKISHLWGQRPPPPPLVKGVGTKRLEKGRVKPFYFSIDVWLLYDIFSLNGVAIANSYFAVIGNCQYFERLCNNFPFGNPEQDPVTY